MTNFVKGDRVTYRGKSMTVGFVDRDNTLLCRYDDHSLGWTMTAFNERADLPHGGGYYWVPVSDVDKVESALTTKFSVGDRIVCVVRSEEYITSGNVYEVHTCQGNGYITLVEDDDGDNYISFHENFFELATQTEHPALVYVKAEMDKLIAIPTWSTSQNSRYGALTDVLNKFGFEHVRVNKHEYKRIGS